MESLEQLWDRHWANQGSLWGLKWLGFQRGSLASLWEQPCWGWSWDCQVPLWDRQWENQESLWGLTWQD